MSRGTMLGIIITAVCLLGLIGNTLHPRSETTFKSDQQHIREAAASLDAYCGQNPDECKGN